MKAKQTLICGLIAVIIALIFAACPEFEQSHYHNWGEWTVTKAATCTTEGVRTRVCRDDASHIDTQSISIDWSAHNWGEWTFTEPTADNYSYGTKTRICAYNGEHKETDYLEGTYGDFKYTYGALSIAITGYTGPGGAVTIPSTIDGKPVTIIKDRVFQWSDYNDSFGSQLTSVIIPDSVTSIGDSAFYGNKLTSVVIPDSVTTIGSVSSFSSYGGVFAGNQLTSVTIGNSVTTIGYRAFAGNYDGTSNQLTSVTIPNSVTTIGSEAFAYNKLASVTIGNSVTEIGSSAFAGDGNSTGNQLTSINIPNSVITIGRLAFMGNQLTSVTIGNSVTTIGNGAFAANQLTSVTIPNSVTTIGNGAFYNNQLTSVTIPNSVTTIRNGAFSNNQLTSVTIGAGVTLGLTSYGTYYATFPDNLDSVYTTTNNKAAGTYTRTNASVTTWTKSNP